MPRLVILPVARADLIEIGDFIAQDTPEHALSFVDKIEVKSRISTRYDRCAKTFLPAISSPATVLFCFEDQ